MHDWKKCEREGFRTRDAHLLQHLARDERIKRILVVNRPVSWSEWHFRRVPKVVRHGTRIWGSNRAALTQVAEKTFCLDLFSFEVLKPLWLKRDWWFRAFQNPQTLRGIRRACRHLQIEAPVVWLWSPYPTGVIGNLGESLVVFDALDNWVQHPEIRDRRGYIAACYRLLQEKADVIFTNSKEMRDFLKTGRLEPIFIPNGVDPQRFRVKAGAPPADLRGLPRPWIGYAGKITRKMDIELLSHLAQTEPNFSFIFIGQSLNPGWFKPLRRWANVYYLGDKHYDDLPAYLAHFDICLIPYRPEVSRMMDPLKLYEYLAAGKPVVSTRLSGVEPFRDHITIADNKEEFLEGIRSYWAALRHNPDLGESLRACISPDCYWSTKARAMMDIIVFKLQDTKINRQNDDLA